jgi:hypothetical protein
MSPAGKANTARSIVDDVFGRARTREIWTGNYGKALPVSVQEFDLSAVLPAVFYMFRFGHRRGKGKFLEAFGGDAKTTKERRRGATIERVASKLARAEAFEGFVGPTEQAILGGRWADNDRHERYRTPVRMGRDCRNPQAVRTAADISVRGLLERR